MKLLTVKARKETFVNKGAIGGTLPLVFYNHIAHNFPEVRFTFLSALWNFLYAKEKRGFPFCDKNFVSLVEISNSTINTKNDGAGDTKQRPW